MIAVIVPTIPGREDSLDRTWESYARANGEHNLIIQIHFDSPSSGAGWKAGVSDWVKRHGKPDYVHLTNDDCELTGSLLPAIEACDQGNLPAPIVRNPNGSIQSAGGQLGANANLLTEIQPDGSPVDFTTIPFMSWEQWQRIGMLPIHYASDVWVSYRGRQFGYETVLRHGYEFTHHNHPVGRGAGMSQNDRDAQDRAIMHGALAGGA